MPKQTGGELIRIEAKISDTLEYPDGQPAARCRATHNDLKKKTDPSKVCTPCESKKSFVDEHGRKRRQNRHGQLFQHLSVVFSFSIVIASFVDSGWPALNENLETALGGEDRDHSVTNLHRNRTKGKAFNDSLHPHSLQGCSSRGGNGAGEEKWGEGWPWEQWLPRRVWGRQWYVQTSGVLTTGQRLEMEDDAGLKLGPYYSDNVHLLIATFDEACRMSRARHVAWIGEREAREKLDHTIISLNQSVIDSAKGTTGVLNAGFSKGIRGIPLALNVGLWPHAQRDKAATSMLLAAQISEAITSEFSMNVSVRAPSLDKLVVEVPVDSACHVAEWLVNDAYVLSIELKTMFASRNRDSNRILMSGPSAISKALKSTVLERAGLNGSGVTIGVADTGVDFDHCMLWQPSFPWICFDPFPSLKTSDELERSRRCPLSAYAGLLENPDFESFLRLMLTTKVDVPIMASGRTKGTSSKLVPLDVKSVDDQKADSTSSAASPRAWREEKGLVFQLGSGIGYSYRWKGKEKYVAHGRADELGLLELLKAWQKVRQPLLRILTRTNSCKGGVCGGKITYQQGVNVFTPSTPFSFDKDDRTWDVVNSELGKNWTAFENILTEKCFCFWTQINTATVDPIEQWQGPIPPVRQFLEMTTTPTASIVRKGRGLPAIPEEILEGLCSATRGGIVKLPYCTTGTDFLSGLKPGCFERGCTEIGCDSPCTLAACTPDSKPVGLFTVPGHERDKAGVRTAMCGNNISYEFEKENTTIGPCDLKWEPRAVESALARCVAAAYLPDPQYVQKRADNNVNEDNKGDPYLYQEGSPKRYPLSPIDFNIEKTDQIKAKDVKAREDAIAFGRAIPEPSFTFELIKKQGFSVYPVDGAAKTQKDYNTRIYTYNTTLEWWKEYTRLPPMDHTDVSRRQVHSYYTMKGCEPCGMCARLRLDSRDYDNIVSSSTMPATLLQNGLFFMHLKPKENDWRLDPYEARNVGFSAEVHVELKFLMQTTLEDAGDFQTKIGFCVLSDHQYSRAADTKTRKYWVDNCINLGGRIFGDKHAADVSARVTSPKDIETVKTGLETRTLHFLAGVSSFDMPTCYQEMISYQQCKAACSISNCTATIKPVFKKSSVLDAGQPIWYRTEKIAKLPPSADGWRVVAWNNGTSDVEFRIILQLFTLPVDCSDAKDGATQFGENLHSVNLGNKHVRSLSSNDQCLKDGRTYCDGTYYSGRQLDLCLVCGGSCFPPSCSRQSCYGLSENENLARIRYLGDIPQKVVSKVFDIVPATTRCEYPCKSPTDPAIRTVGDDCNFKYECRKRIETYDVDTSMQEVRAGVPFVFAKGRLLFESKRKDRMVRMRILALTDPTFHRRTAATFNGTQGGGQLKLSSNLPRSTINGKTIIIVKNMNITQRLEGNSDAFYCASWRQGCITEKPTEIEVVINESYIPDLLDGLTYTASTDSGTNMTNRQRMIRIQIQFLQQSMKPWPSIMPLDTGYEGGRDAETGMCKPGFASKFLPRACDTIFPPFELRMVVEPVDRGQRVVRPKNGEGSGGRKTVLSRDGHGTHVVTSIVGNALENVPANTPDPTTWQEYVNVVSQALDKTSTVIRKFNGLATGAQMSFFDIGKSGNVYLTPPESLGDALFGRPYREGRARIFLNPWTCEDYVWWRKQDQDFSIEQEVAFSSALNTNSSICNRYGSDAWEVDDFVARYPDLLVIFPSGDNGAGGINTVSSPGTCKNCLTVGTSFSWPESLETSIDFELNQCQDIDCPQDVDKTETCADPKRASPFLVPACCRKKYKSGAYAPGDVDPRSSRGHAVNKQAPFNVFGGKTYSDLTALEFQRFKPEVVAPGVNIVSGRSDGDTESLGTNPKLGNNDDVLVQPERCRLDNRKLDRACLSTMSGSSMAAAKVTAIAALVHQYFADGYHPGGKKGFATFPFDPSAALVKSVILASADQMYRSLSLNASITDIATLPVPNFYYGFGRPRLMNVLTVDTEPEDVPSITSKEIRSDACNCSRCSNMDNSLLFANGPVRGKNMTSDEYMKLVKDSMHPNSMRFGADYGLTCAPWNAMKDGRPQQCDTMFGLNPAARQTPPGLSFDPNELDDTCCVSWCFVDESCPSSVKQEWSYVPGMYYSTQICQQDATYQKQCPFQDKSLVRTIKMAVFDHQVFTAPTHSGNASLDCNTYGLEDAWKCEYMTFTDTLKARRGAIAQNESIMYTFRIGGASRQHPLVASMVYTDPVGAQGSPSILVNDLDLHVRVSPLMGTGPIKSRPLDLNVSTLYYGNGVQGGDRVNNAEVVRITSSGPAEIVASVKAVRIASSMPGASSFDGICQPFALVLTGQIDLDLKIYPIPITTDPPNLISGICGRAPAKPEDPPPGLAVWQIVLIVLGAAIGAFIVMILFYKFAYKASLDRFKRRFNTAKPDKMGYVSELTKVHTEEGIARDGGHDFIILASSASAEEGFYDGLPINILDGQGAGESAIITKYHGRTKRADVEFESKVGPGSRYSISHGEGLGMGYKIGQSGYMPVGNLPQPDEYYGPLYSKQFEAQAHARLVHGNLEDQELSDVGIGHEKRVLTQREKVQRLHAARCIGEAVSSGDLYRVSVSQSDAEWDGTIKEPQPLMDFVEAKRRNIALTKEGGFENPEGLKGRNSRIIFKGSQSREPPPLRSQPRAGSGFRVPGFTSPSRNSTGLSKIADNLKVNAKTWESEDFDMFFDNPPEEPASTTTDARTARVVATLTTPRINGNSMAKSRKGNGTAAVEDGTKDTKKLLSKAFD